MLAHADRLVGQVGQVRIIGAVPVLLIAANLLGRDDVRRLGRHRQGFQFRIKRIVVGELRGHRLLNNAGAQRLPVHVQARALHTDQRDILPEPARLTQDGAAAHLGPPHRRDARGALGPGRVNLPDVLAWAPPCRWGTAPAPSLPTPCKSSRPPARHRRYTTHHRRCRTTARRAQARRRTG